MKDVGHFRAVANFGRYNLCSMKKEWQLSLGLPKGAPTPWIYAYFEEDNKPDASDPFEALETIRDYYGRVWVDTSKKKGLEAIAWCDEHPALLAVAHHSEMVESLKRCISEMSQRLKRHEVVLETAVADLATEWDPASIAAETT